MKKRLKNKIAEILNDQHLTPYRLAKLMDLPAPTVYNWYNNKSNPSQQYIVELMKLLGVTLDQLLEVECE